jgi:hypothetical protein
MLLHAGIASASAVACTAMYSATRNPGRVPLALLE